MTGRIGVAAAGWQVPVASDYLNKSLPSLSGSESLQELVVLADSELAANGRVRGLQRLTIFKSLAAGRPPLSRVHPSREWQLCA